jgi:tyrosine aminotransferase
VELYSLNLFLAMSEDWEEINISDYAKLSINPLRQLKFEQIVKPNSHLPVITLQLGDPSIFGNFPSAKECLEAFKSSVDLDTFLYNGGNGKLEAREAVAKYSSNQGDVSANDVVLTSGKFLIGYRFVGI